MNLEKYISDEDRFVLDRLPREPTLRKFRDPREALGNKKGRRAKWVMEQNPATGNSDRERKRKGFTILKNLQANLPADKYHLIGQFLEGNGPAAVLAFISRVDISNQVMTGEGGALRGEEFKKVTGLVFERLAYLDIKNTSGETSDTLLDPGSTSRVFNRFHQENLATFTPDGVSLRIQNGIPVINHLYEYKLNPDKYDFITQINRMDQFLTKNRGKVLEIPGLLLDRINNLKTNYIEVDKNASIIVVSPKDRQPNNIDPRVILRQASFNARFAVRVAAATVDDLLEG